jgi:hypothetical protein
MYERKELTVYAGYRQFYLLDGANTGDTGSVEFWTDEAFNTRLAVVPGVIGISTDTYGSVPVTLELVESEPPVNLDGWDHVVEASILLSTGRLQVVGCPDYDQPVLDTTVVPGRYRVRGSFASLLAEPNGDYNDDSYLIQMWRSNVDGRLVLKQFVAPR